MVVSAPRCTPPMPPVAKTRMPTISAMSMVVATVVAPVWPFAMYTGTSRRETLPTFSALHMTARSASFRPTLSLPPMMAMVAGTAPLSRTTCSTFAAKSRFSG